VRSTFISMYILIAWLRAIWQSSGYHCPFIVFRQFQD
jgi:hypothetical protein